MLINPGHAWLPLIGTGAMYRHCGMQLHRVPDHHLGLSLRHDLDFATDGAAWIACVAFADGRIAIVPRSPSMAPLPADQREKMVEVAILANRELHHGGHWVMAVANDELCALWRDQDGDMQFDQSWPDTWARLHAKPREEWVDTLEACWQVWDERMRSLRDPNALIKRALGERSKAPPSA